jgi:HEAT repeat protein
LVRTLLLLGSALILLLVNLRLGSASNPYLWVGFVVQALLCLVLLWTAQLGQEPVGFFGMSLYLVGLGWLLLGSYGMRDWVISLAQAALVLIPLVLFALQSLRDSGASEMRAARMLAARLAARKDWPADLLACRDLPEALELRNLLGIDASPALELLTQARAALRIVALTALECRTTWRLGQTDFILKLAQKAPEPQVRATAILSLAALDDRALLVSIADLLRDPDLLVRQTAAFALLWRPDRKWYWFRDGIRNSLNDTAFQKDGALLPANLTLSKEAVADFTAWCSENSVIAYRSAVTLGVHYSRILASGALPELLEELRATLLKTGTPPLLRLELLRLLQRNGELTNDDFRILLNPTMPASVRLIAIDALLSVGAAPDAVAALRDLARLQNRELALDVARTVQFHLHIYMGLPKNGTLPQVQSREAAEVARLVANWAAQADFAPQENVPMPPPEHPEDDQLTWENSRVDL